MKPYKTVKEKNKHIESLFNAMVNRIPVKVKGSRSKTLIIQRINMDGECDIFDRNTEKSEITHYEIPCYEVIPTK